MEVKYRRFGCLDGIGCVFSLGLLPLLLWFSMRQSPTQLTEQEMILSNGKRIPWDQFTSAKATDMYFKGSASSKGAYMGTRFNLKHAGGTIKFSTNRMDNGREVVQYIYNHVPPHLLNR